MNLLGAIVSYGVLGLTVLRLASACCGISSATPDAAASLSSLTESISQTWYVTVIAVSLLYQGGMARHFMQRRDALASYRHAVPTWARDVVESMAG